jgi:hypothetical protein
MEPMESILSAEVVYRLAPLHGPNGGRIKILAGNPSDVTVGRAR